MRGCMGILALNFHGDGRHFRVDGGRRSPPMPVIPSLRGIGYAMFSDTRWIRTREKGFPWMRGVSGYYVAIRDAMRVDSAGILTPDDYLMPTFNLKNATQAHVSRPMLCEQFT